MPQDGSGNAEVEYYKLLARLAEERAREVRRVAALERARFEERLLEQQPTIDAYAADLERLKTCYECLKAKSERLKDDNKRLKREAAEAKAEMGTVKRAQDRIAASRAHRLASGYVRIADGNSRLARILRLLACPLKRVSQTPKSE
jgi:hypothetical protein